MTFGSTGPKLSIAIMASNERVTGADSTVLRSFVPACDVRLVESWRAPR